MIVFAYAQHVNWTKIVKTRIESYEGANGSLHVRMEGAGLETTLLHNVPIEQIKASLLKIQDAFIKGETYVIIPEDLDGVFSSADSTGAGPVFTEVEIDAADVDLSLDNLSISEEEVLKSNPLEVSTSYSVHPTVERIVAAHKSYEENRLTRREPIDVEPMLGVQRGAYAKSNLTARAKSVQSHSLLPSNTHGILEADLEAEGVRLPTYQEAFYRHKVDDITRRVEVMGERIQELVNRQVLPDTNTVIVSSHTNLKGKIVLVDEPVFGDHVSDMDTAIQGGLGTDYLPEDFDFNKKGLKRVRPIKLSTTPVTSTLDDSDHIQGLGHFEPELGENIIQELTEDFREALHNGG